MSRLNLPARKSFIQELKIAAEIPPPPDNNIKGLLLWKVKTLGQDRSFSVVWIQGEVTEMESREFFSVMDTTGVAKVIKSNSVPPGCPEVQNGKYVMVIGELQESGDLPIIKATKIQDLSHDITAKDMWPLEVIDLHLYSGS